MMLHNIKIKFKAFSPGILDKTVVGIVTKVREIGGEVVGPIPLPNKIERFVVTRAPHVYKKSCDEFMRIKHTRVLYIRSASPSVIEEFSKIEISSGVGIEVSIVQS